VTGPPRDWDKEMAEIDKLIAKQPVAPPKGPELLGRPAPAALPAGRPAAAPAPVSSRRDALWTWLGVLAGAGVAGAVVFAWPYRHDCGLPLYGYLAASGGVLVVGLWGAVTSWTRRISAAHFLALLVTLTGAVLVGKVLLDRTEYPRVPAAWRCGP
jgi:hypothetical protein